MAQMAQEGARMAAGAPAWRETMTMKVPSVPGKALNLAPALTTGQEMLMDPERDPDSGAMTTSTLMGHEEGQTMGLMAHERAQHIGAPKMAVAQERAQDLVLGKAMTATIMLLTVPGAGQGLDLKEMMEITPERDHELDPMMPQTAKSMVLTAVEEDLSSDQAKVGTTASTDRAVPEKVPSWDQAEEATILMNMAPMALVEAHNLGATMIEGVPNLGQVTLNMAEMEHEGEVNTTLMAPGESLDLVHMMRMMALMPPGETQTLDLADKALTLMAPTSGMMATFTAQMAGDSPTMVLMDKVPIPMVHTLVLMEMFTVQMDREGAVMGQMA